NRAMLWTAAAVAGCLIVLTASRSGIVGLLAMLAALWLLVGRQAAQGSRALRVGFGVSAALLLAAGSLSLLDPPLLAQVKTIVQPARLLDEVKVRAWRDVPRVIHDYWTVGVGRGAFEQIFPSYKRLP